MAQLSQLQRRRQRQVLRVRIQQSVAHGGDGRIVEISVNETRAAPSELRW